MIKAINISSRGAKRFTSLEEDFQKIHRYKYNYSKFIYYKAKEKSIITCKIHGDFTQSANDHLNGYGCYKCGIETVTQARRKTSQEFIKEATAKHGITIKYSAVVYTDSKTPVTLICKKHGEFTQQPQVHLMATYPCPKCASDARGIAARNNNAKFIQKAQKVHSNTYLYGRVSCKTTNDKVIITCKLHGDFKQLQGNHIAGNGCPTCASSGFNETIPAILYYVSVNNGEAYKIGITNNTIKERFRKDYKNITVLGYVSFLIGADARKKETEIIRKYKKFKYKGKPLLNTGNSELFTVDILNLTRKNK